MRLPTRVHPAIFLAPLALVVAGCSPAASSPAASEAAGSGAAGGTTVDVTLQEWAVVPAETSAPAGTVTFAVTNDGPDDIHEFVIIRTDLEPGDLPVDETGAVDEAGEGMEVVDEIEDIPVGETQEVTVDLEAGSYVLLCNIYSADEDEAHYTEGMRVAFTVE
jgi:iron uptake system component EfeO